MAVVMGALQWTTVLSDAATGRELHEVEHARAPAFSTDGSMLATSYLQDVTLRNATTGADIRECDRAAKAEVYALAFSPDGKSLAWTSRTDSNDADLGLWDTATGQRLRRVGLGLRELTSVTFSPNGNAIAVGSLDPAVRLWELAPSRSARSLAGDKGGTLAVAFSGNGTILAASQGAGAVQLWESRTGRRLRRLRTGLNVVSGLALAPDGETMAAVDRGGAVSLWNATTGARVRELAPQSGYAAMYNSVAFSSDGATLAASSPGAVTLWSWKSGISIRRLDPKTTFSGPLAFSPDGKTLATAIMGDSRTSKQSAVRLWNAKTGQVTGEFTSSGGEVRALAYSPDGKTLAVGSFGVVQLWDTATRSEVLRFQDHAAEVWTLAFSPDGKLLASGSRDGRARLRRASNGEIVATFIYVSSTNSHIVLSSDGHVEVLGKDEPAVWQRLACRIGPSVFPSMACRERRQVRGLLPKLLAPDTSYQQP
jgi:WD40 repeat protein